MEKVANSIKTLYDSKFKNNRLIHWYDQQHLFKVKNHLKNGIIDLKYFEFFECYRDENDNIYLKNETEEELQVFENILTQIFEFYKNEKSVKIKSISLSGNNIGYKSFLILYNLMVNYMSLDADMFIKLKKISLCSNFLNNKCLELLCDLLYSFPEKYESLEEFKLGFFIFGQKGEENINDDGFLNLVLLIQKRPKLFSKLKLLYLDSLGITIKSIINLIEHKIFLPNLNTLLISKVIENSFKSNQDAPILLNKFFNNLYKCCPSLECIHYTSYKHDHFRQKLGRILKVLNKTKSKLLKIFKKIKFTNEIKQKFCPITLEDFKENETILQIINCNHIFSKKAIIKWSQNHNNCPLCRTSFL